MVNRKGFRFSKEHEWVKVEGNKAYVGITQHAQEALGDIVFVELPEEGKELTAGDVVGVVESVKAASDVYTPISGRVAEVNRILEASPEKLNEAPYEYWIAAVELIEPQEVENLMDEETYEKFCMEEES